MALGYPNGLKKDEIPYVAQIIRVADEYDAIVSKRQYKTHVNISQTLEDLIKDAKPNEIKKTIALDQLSLNYQYGKINVKILKILFKVVVDDIYYEIDGIQKYIKFLKSEVKRLKQIDEYNKKMNSVSSEKKKNYYLEGINLLFEENENINNYSLILNDYENAVLISEQRETALFREIELINKLRKQL